MPPVRSCTGAIHVDPQQATHARSPARILLWKLHVGGILLRIFDSVEVSARDVYHAYLRAILGLRAPVVLGQALQVRGGHAPHGAERF